MHRRTAFSLFALAVSPLLTGCPSRTSAGTSPSPMATASAPDVAQTPARFKDVTQAAGITYRWQITGKRPLNILQTIGTGCAFLDYDGDKNLDILLVGPKMALYKGDGAGKFMDVSQATGITGLKGNFLGCAVGDVDRDGRPDVYLSAYRGGALLLNQGGKTFKDVTKAYGLPPQPWGTSAGFADLSGDGYLDLYVANYADFGPTTKPQLCSFHDKKGQQVLSSCGPKFYKGIKGVMFENVGGKKFRDVTRAWGMDSHSGRGLGVAFGDIDNSGRLSVAVANDEAPGDLFLNQAKPAPKRMENIGTISGTSHDRDGSIHGGMGIDFGDYNNDGKLDLFVATFRNEAKNLYRNDGENTFTDISYPSGIGQAALPYVTFGAKFLDADNDGYLDLMLANGHVQDNIADIEDSTYEQPIAFFHNQKGQGYADASKPSGVTDITPIVGRGLAVGDYDNDGKVDVLVTNPEGAPVLLHNESQGGSNWAGIVLERADKKALEGTRITLEAGGLKQVRVCQTAGSYLSASDARVHFGLGTASSVDKVTVQWPGGKTTTHQVPVGKYTTLRLP